MAAKSYINLNQKEVFSHREQARTTQRVEVSGENAFQKSAQFGATQSRKRIEQANMSKSPKDTANYYSGNTQQRNSKQFLGQSELVSTITQALHKRSTNSQSKAHRRINKYDQPTSATQQPIANTSEFSPESRMQTSPENRIKTQPD